jgi:hypothetical protein
MVVVADPAAVGDAVSLEVAAAAGTAARPVRGYVDAAAEAVLFADETELLACYLLAVRSGRVGVDWFWAQLAGILPPPSLPALVRDQGVPVVGVVAEIDEWELLATVFGGIDAATERWVVEAIANQHDLWVGDSSDRPAAIAGAAAEPVNQADSASVRRHAAGQGEPGKSSQRPEVGITVGRRGSDRVLARVGSGASFAPSLGRLARILLGRRVAVEDTRAAATAGGHPQGAVPVLVDPSARFEDVAHGAGLSSRSLTRHRPMPGGRQVSAVPEPRFVYSRDAEAPVEEGTAAAPVDSGVPTRLAGVLYLVNPYRRLDCAALGLADAAHWDVIDGLGREALESVDALDDRDLLWDALAGLAGRAPGEAPAPTVLQRCRTALARIEDDLALADHEPSLGRLLLVPARIHVGTTHVEVVAPLDAVHLSVRRRALDSDPGWVPALGRVIRFHFVGTDEDVAH